MNFYHVRFISVLTVLFLSQILLNLAAQNSNRLIEQIPKQTLQKSDPRLYKALTFGHYPIATDWLWIKVLTDDTLSRVPTGTYSSLFYEVDLATELDPAFYEVYWAGANLLIMARKDSLGARDLLLKGNRFIDQDLPQFPAEFREEYWKNRWNVPILLAYVYLFEFNDMPSAATAFSKAATFPNAPPYLHSLAQRLTKPNGQYEVGLRLLDFMIAGAKEDRRTQDGRVLENLILKKQNLQIAAFLADINQAFLRFSSNAGGKRNWSGLWQAYLKKSSLIPRDPWGGRLDVDATGHVVSSTPYEAVFGIK